MGDKRSRLWAGRSEVEILGEVLAWVIRSRDFARGRQDVDVFGGGDNRSIFFARLFSHVEVFVGGDTSRSLFVR